MASNSIVVGDFIFTDDDHTVPQDTREVLAASSLLQITEFHLFELAFTRWFGREPKEGELEGGLAWARVLSMSMSVSTSNDLRVLTYPAPRSRQCHMPKEPC